MIKILLFCVMMTQGEVCMNDEAFEKYVATRKNDEIVVKVVAK